jgi:hypothetical protein
VTRCSKVYFPDQARARAALAVVKEKKTNKWDSLPVRVYPCDVCDGWHLTSKRHKGKKPAWDRDPSWTRPGGTEGLERRERTK